MTTDPLQPLIDTLHADGRPRIWSLVITIFGDCVQHRGGRISSTRLSRLLARIGVEPGALRTALSRLSQDGWVEGNREGRTSNYRLTARGVLEFGTATSRIYAAPRSGPVATWVFDSPPRDGALKLAGGSLRPAPVPDRATGLRIEGPLTLAQSASLWEGLNPAHRQALERMAQDLTAQNLIDGPDLDAAAARILLVHRWRRLILRWPELPTELTPKALHPRDLHGAMASAYRRLTPATERWLNSEEGEMRPMAPATRDPSSRFTPAQTS